MSNSSISYLPASCNSVASPLPSLPPFFLGWEQWHSKLKESLGGFTPQNRAEACAAVQDFCAGEDCDHDLELTYHLASNGAKMYVMQCSRCWARVGQWVSQKALTADQMTVAPRAVTSEDRWAAIEGIKLTMLSRINAEANSALTSNYHEYLVTPEWGSIRARVLKRDNNICQGCLEQPATQVHHLSYEHQGHEFAFELVGVCRDCHELLHPEKVQR